MNNRSVNTKDIQAPRGRDQEDASTRIRDMDLLIRWEGELTNARIREVFGVQAVQSSRLLGAYIAERGDAILRATPRAPLTPSPRFDSLVPASTPDDYLRLISGASVALPGRDLVVESRPTRIGENAELFAALLTASRASTGLRITYGSMNHPDGKERTIFPHSLVRAPRRWHVRAWCGLRQEFRDFALGRVLSFAPVEEASPKTRRHDTGWNKLVSLKIVAHPAFDEARQLLLRREYFAGKPGSTVRVRKALAGYVVQDLRLATDLKRDRPPQFQLYLENADALGSLFSVS